MLNRYALARTLGGLLGLGVGYLLWEGLRDAMLREIPAGAWEAATASDAFVSLIGIAAVALIMTPGWCCPLSQSRRRNGCRALHLARLASTGLDRGERAAAPFADADLQRARVGTVPTFETRRSLSSVSV